ncbi:MAG: LysR family transcriptional regulator [Burkholderiaceae bacterium]|jgi:LysR family transcriptional activator of nhaA|nr:LysR family transcriptional regulator [Burkholderiaceae bacterium]
MSAILEKIIPLVQFNEWHHLFYKYEHKNPAMAELNLHHLRYFRAIAHEQGLARAAERLHVSASALSVQLRQLEERLGHTLFERRGRRLVLTEAGRVALEHADTIHAAGEELLATFKGRPRGRVSVLRVGSVATLSRNFQLLLLRPLLARDDVQLRLESGRLRELLLHLGAHELDVVLASEAVPRDAAKGWRSVLIAQQPLAIVSAVNKGRRAPALPFPQGLDGQPLLLPGGDHAARSAFDTLLADAGVRPRVLAEVDDMAMLRLLARETGALALVPPVVVQDELAARTLVERCRVPQLHERFYAITADRRFPHPLLKLLLQPGLQESAASP